MEEALVRERNVHGRTGNLGTALGIAVVLLAFLLTIRILVAWLPLR